MGTFSILPERFSYIEDWVSTICIVLGVITIGPWLLVFLYDFLLYVWRITTHNLPVIGGAAKGERRPQAPSLARRPSGHRRRFSLAALSGDLGNCNIPENEEYEVHRHDSVAGSPEMTSEFKHRTPASRGTQTEEPISEDVDGGR